MKLIIDETDFGSITINNQRFEHDLVITWDGTIRKRHKKLSKAVYGTSHMVSLDEAKDVYQKGAKEIIIGSGQYARLELSDEARNYFAKKKCRVRMYPTPEAIEIWNQDPKKKIIGLFQITC